MKNPFNNKMLIDELSNFRLCQTNEFNGPAFACVFPCMKCCAQCKQCFFRSLAKVSEKLIPEEHTMSDCGIDKTIRFLNDANVQYLLISGGGETMEHPKAVYSMIREVKAKRIVLVTAGYFATNLQKCKKMLGELYAALKSRQDDCHLVVRLSIDKGHFENLGMPLVTNLINEFKSHYSDEQFELQIHTMLNDDTVNKVAELLGAHITPVGVNVDDGKGGVLKNVPYRSVMEFENGFKIKIGHAKLFYPSLNKDLSNPEALDTAIEVYNRDLTQSEGGNPSVAFSGDGVKGLDLWINNNGQVSTWGNQQPDLPHNIYVDGFSCFRNDILTKVTSRAYLDKGDDYRCGIIAEVNPKAVLRTKAANIRDYAGAQIFQEDRTRMYFAVRALQDYIAEGTIELSELDQLTVEAKQVVLLEKEQLKALYKSSTYDIIKQTLRTHFDNVEEWKDIMLLVSLSHFDCCEENIRLMLDHYYMLTGVRYHSLSEVQPDDDDVAQYARLMHRLTKMSKKAYDFCVNSCMEAVA